MADYESFPLWRGGVNVDPAGLPLSAGLVDGLLQWANDYDRTLNRDDPVASGFADSEAEAAFSARGEELARRLAREMGDGWNVAYFDPRAGWDVAIGA
jgi:hypothetical protein